MPVREKSTNKDKQRKKIDKICQAINLLGTSLLDLEAKLHQSENTYAKRLEDLEAKYKKQQKRLKTSNLVVLDLTQKLEELHDAFTTISRNPVSVENNVKAGAHNSPNEEASLCSDLTNLESGIGEKGHPKCSTTEDIVANSDTNNAESESEQEKDEPQKTATLTPSEVHGKDLNEPTMLKIPHRSKRKRRDPSSFFPDNAINGSDEDNVEGEYPGKPQQEGDMHSMDSASENTSPSPRKRLGKENQQVHSSKKRIKPPPKNSVQRREYKFGTPVILLEPVCLSGTEVSTELHSSTGERIEETENEITEKDRNLLEVPEIERNSLSISDDGQGSSTIMNQDQDPSNINNVDQNQSKSSDNDEVYFSLSSEENDDPKIPNNEINIESSQCIFDDNGEVDKSSPMELETEENPQIPMEVDKIKRKCVACGRKIKMDPTSKHNVDQFQCKRCRKVLQSKNIEHVEEQDGAVVLVESGPSSLEISTQESLSANDFGIFSGFEKILEDHQDWELDPLLIFDNEQDSTSVSVSDDNQNSVKIQDNNQDFSKISEDKHDNSKSYNDKQDSNIVNNGQDPSTISYNERDPLINSCNDKDSASISDSKQDPFKIREQDHDSLISDDDDDPSKISDDDEDPSKISDHDEDSSKISDDDEDPSKISDDDEDSSKISDDDKDSSKISDDREDPLKISDDGQNSSVILENDDDLDLSRIPEKDEDDSSKNLEDNKNAAKITEQLERDLENNANEEGCEPLSMDLEEQEEEISIQGNKIKRKCTDCGRKIKLKMKSKHNINEFICKKCRKKNQDQTDTETLIIDDADEIAQENELLHEVGSPRENKIPEEVEFPQENGFAQELELSQDKGLPEEMELPEQLDSTQKKRMRGLPRNLQRFVYKCQICKKNITGISSYYRHLRLHDKSNVEQESNNGSPKIKRSSIITKTLNENLSDTRKSMKYACEICREEVLPKDFKSHISTHEEARGLEKRLPPTRRGRPATKIYMCRRCHKQFSTHEKQFQHFTDIHGRFKPYGCTSCENRFDTDYALGRHKKRSHSGQNDQKN